MKRPASIKAAKGGVIRAASDHEPHRFLPVFDSRKRKVRRFVTRNGHYYGQMSVSLADGRHRFSIRLDEAIAGADRARTEKRSGNLHLPGHRPQFSELVRQYLESALTAFRDNRARSGVSKEVFE